MNSKMTTNYQQLNLKKPKNKQLEQEQSHRNGDHMEGFQWGGEQGEWGGKVQGLRSIKWQVQNRQGGVKIGYELWEGVQDGEE